MKRFCYFLLAVLCISFVSGAADKSKQPVHRVMTANLRITNLPDDEKPGRRWLDRRDVCVKAILQEKPDIVCTQEMIYDSYEYLKSKLKNYQAFGFEGPEMDPYTEGYHLIGKNVIFFNTKRYEFISGGCYWLSDEPLKGGSCSWGTNRARHCNYVRLRDRRTGKQLRVLDVHLDHKSKEARGRQMEIIVDECAQYSAEFPQIICGDFNSGIKDLPVSELRKAGWTEMWEAVNGQREYGFSCHLFQGTDYKPKGKNRRIDFMFTHGPIRVNSAEVLTKAINGIWPSDHFFVVSEFVIE